MLVSEMNIEPLLFRPRPVTQMAGERVTGFQLLFLFLFDCFFLGHQFRVLPLFVHEQRIPFFITLATFRAIELCHF